MATTYTIDEDSSGVRADIFATRKLPTISRAYVHKLFANGKIVVNDEKTKAGYKLRAGDELSIDFSPEELDAIPDIDVPIIYEDDDVLVVDKPDGVISHSRGRYWNEPSVASFVRQKTGQDGDRAGIVHRLDRATSGVMVCAKNEAAMSWLQKQFSSRKVKKTYYAVIAGHMSQEEAIIDMPIERNPKAPATFRVGPNGKSSQTQYRVITSSDSYDMVELTPLTGRTHQLRVHLKQVGHPIVGDVLYSDTPASRMYLHAHKLEITLPSGTRTVFESPLPKEFDYLIGHNHEEPPTT